MSTLQLIEAYKDIRKRYKRAYMGAKRWESVRKFGYDVKNAAHLVRLLHMGLEYVTEGRLHVRRAWDRDMLLAIKRGEWELPAIKAHAEAYFKRLESAKSRLPVGIDEDAVGRLVLYIITERLGLREQEYIDDAEA